MPKILSLCIPRLIFSEEAQPHLDIVTKPAPQLRKEPPFSTFSGNGSLHEDRLKQIASQG